MDGGGGGEAGRRVTAVRTWASNEQRSAFSPSASDRLVPLGGQTQEKRVK